MEPTKIDIAIIGGGIVGLWCAYEILKKKPNLSVVVFEKENYLGEHTTGRNSEVLHAGIYYEYNSLKHLLCLEGNILWREFSKNNRLDFLDCGKYIVANQKNAEKLEMLFYKAQKNNVPLLRKAGSSEINELKPFVSVDSAFYSGSSAVLDTSTSLKCLQYLIESLGGVILKNSEVKNLNIVPAGFSFLSNNDPIQSEIVINSAGLFAVKLREQLGLFSYTDRYVKGNYLKLTKKIPINKLIYPIPPEHGLGLGIHLTLDNQGEQKFGPNTEETKSINYNVNDSLIDELYPAIQDIFFTVKKSDLQLAYAGIRPKVHDKDDRLVTDFLFNTEKEHLVKNYFELLGIESPGLTSAPAIAKKISNRIFN